MSSPWQAGADNATLAARGRLLRSIREYFHKRGVLEVATPLLGAAGVSDVHIENVTAADGARRYFLQTSPEYAMKRLLASGSGPIYQIGPAVRGGESGGRHNVEFTMLEWYRPGFDQVAMLAEVEALVSGAVHMDDDFDRVRYRDLFVAEYATDPHTASVDVLRRLARDRFGDKVAHIVDHDDDATRNDYLDVLFSCGIEASLVRPVLVTEFPATQAALAETGPDAEGATVAYRFELFWKAVEIANGYQELTDADELAGRIRLNNVQRERRGLPGIPADDKLLAALPAMPAGAGVALGVDRLLMAMLDKDELDAVLAFSSARL